MSEQKLSNNATISRIIVSTLGSGITFMPSVFNLLGSKLAFTLMIVIGTMTFFSIYFLSYSAIASREDDGFESKSSYTSLAEKFSPVLKMAVALSLCISSLLTVFSFTQTFIKILLGTINYNKDLVEFVYKNQSELKATIAFFISTIYFFLFQLDDLSSLSIFSNFSLLTAVIFSVFVAIIGLYKPSENIVLPADKKLDIVGPLGLVIFALHCQFSFLDIFNSMKDTSLANVRSVVLKASVFATVLYSLVGYLGFKAIGTAIEDKSLIFLFSENENILNNLQDRYGSFLGYYVPKILHAAFGPIFFSGIVFNMFSIIPVFQKALSFGNKPISRRTMSFIASLFVFFSAFPKIESLELLFAIAGFLLTTPLSFLFPSVFMLYTKSKIGLLGIVAKLMILVSIVIMIGLSLMTYLKEGKKKTE